MSRRVRRELPFGSGYVPSVEPSVAGDGFPDAENVTMDVASSSLRAIDGFTRLNTTAYGVGTGSSIEKFDPTSLGIAKGVGLAVIANHDNDKVYNVTVNQGANTVDYTGAPAALISDLNYTGGVDISNAIANLHGRTYFCDGMNPHRCFDGRDLRLTGIRAPVYPPTLRSQVVSETQWCNCNAIADLYANWIENPIYDFGSIALDEDNFKVGTGSIKFTFSQQPISESSIQSLISAGLTHTAYLFKQDFNADSASKARDAADDCVRFWVMADKFVPAGTFGVFVADPTSIGRGFEVDLYPHVWTLVEVPYTYDSTTLAPNHAAAAVLGLWFGFFNLDITGFFEDLPLNIWIDDVYNVQREQGKLGGTYRSSFSWHDPVRLPNRESGLSPACPPFYMGPRTYKAILDVEGQDTEDTTYVTETKVYLQNMADNAGMKLAMTRNSVGTADIEFNVSADDLSVKTTAHDYHGMPPSCRYAVVHGNRVVWAGQRDWSEGTVDVTQNSNALVGTSTAWKNWHEGYTIRVGDASASDAQRYTVIQVVNGTSMKIAKAINDIGLAYGVYEGSDDTGLSYTLEGKKNTFWWTTKTSLHFGGYSEAVHVLNRMDVAPNDGDEIKGLAAIGRALLIFKKNRTFVSVQDMEYFDDDETGTRKAFTEPELLSDSVGLLAHHSIAYLPDGSVMFLGSGKQVCIGTPEGVEPLPMTDLARAWMETQGDSALALAEAEYDTENRQYILYASNKILRLDFKNGIWMQDNYTGAASIVSLQRIADDNGAQQVIAGCKFGYLSHIYDPDAKWFGNVQTANRYTVSSSTSTIITPTTGGITTTGDGLKNLYLTHVDSSGDMRSYLIASNDATTITVATMNPVPVAGDLIYLGAIIAYADWPEVHYESYAKPVMFLLDATSGTNTEYQIKIFGEPQTSGALWERDVTKPVSGNIVQALKTLRVTKTLMSRPYIPAVGAPRRRSLQYRLRWIRTSITGYRFAEEIVRGMTVIEDLDETEYLGVQNGNA